MKNLRGVICKVLIGAIVLTSITACDDEAISKNDADVGYINALGDQANFYSKKASESSHLFDSGNRTVTLLQGASSEQLRHKWFGYEYTFFGVENANNRDNQVSMDRLLKDSHDYWAVAWLNGSKAKLSMIESVSSDQNDIYRVRIFANKELDVYVDDSLTKSLTTKVGEVSPFLDIRTCTGLVVGQNNIDLCQVDFGDSYLAVVNEVGLVSLVKEKG